MPVEVKVPSVLRGLVAGSRTVEGRGATVGQLLDDLERRYPGIRGRLVSSTGDLYQFVNIYVNDEDIRFLKQLDTPVSERDVISILPALAGGS
ncbi:MAG: MoaD family protein [Chloroflexi bacterium]|nr:MoaD family protein [Chloroflexota bacterium]